MSYQVIQKKLIQVNVAKVFQAFADGPTWSQWFSENTKVDLKIGGRFSNDDGDSGKYIEIIPNQLLKFTWEGFEGSEVEIRLDSINDSQTSVSLRHFQISEEIANKMKICWAWTLDNLASFLEKGRPLPMSEWKTLQTSNKE